MNEFKFYKRESGKLKKNIPIDKTFRNWNKKEKWLILVPHDDDAVIGMGLTIIAGLQSGIDIEVRITCDGTMGYCTPGGKKNIAKIRRKETLDSFKLLGLASKKIKWLNFKDCSLNLQSGRYFIKKPTRSSYKGADGLQNAFTKILRETRPTRVFISTIEDLHPDHQLVHSELMISLFHACADIWPELGKSNPLPELIEFAVYCDFSEPPQIQLTTSPKLFKNKLAGIHAFKSQKQISTLVDRIKENGPEEYLREINFSIYEPKKYRKMFR